MSKNMSSITIVLALSLMLSACMAEQDTPHQSALGSYNSTEIVKDDKGTTTEKESATVITVDEDGTLKETVTTKTSHDPEGLMNKTSKSTKHTTKSKKHIHK